MPLPEELDRATGKELVALQKAMGGDYGFNMGYVDGGKLLRADQQPSRAICVGGRCAEQFAAAAGERQSCRPRAKRALRRRPRPLSAASADSPTLDDPFHNRDGWVAAGVDRDDAVLGASEDSPIPVTLISDR